MLILPFVVALTLDACWGMSVAPWQLDDASRFGIASGLTHPGFPAVGCGCCGKHTVMCVHNRTTLSFSATLGNRWRPSAGGSRLIYIDLGANSPKTSVLPFRLRYPDGHLFATTAFEADPQWYNSYGNGSRACKRHGTCEVTLVPAAVGVTDSVSFLSTAGHSFVHSVASQPDAVHTKAVRTVGFGAWLRANVRHTDWVVCKMDIEKSEFELIPALLAEPSTFRLVDELFLECHHTETWKNGPHTYAECLDMYTRILATGVWVHDYY